MRGEDEKVVRRGRLGVHRKQEQGHADLYSLRFEKETAIVDVGFSMDVIELWKTGVFKCDALRARFKRTSSSTTRS